eukprot:s6496_g1.t1
MAPDLMCPLMQILDIVLSSVANPLLAAYYRFQLEFCSSKPESCADLLMRALPYLFFSKVVSFEEVTSELEVADGLPHEPHCSQAIISVLTEMGYKAFTPRRRVTGSQTLLSTFLGRHSSWRAPSLSASTRSSMTTRMPSTRVYIIGNDNEKMEKTVRKTEGGEVQIIGLVPNIAHTAYAVYVKSKGIELNTFKVDCDLVAKRLVLKDNGKSKLYSVQSLKSDGHWVKEEAMSASLRDTTEADCYGFVLPSADDA